jgi:hypothetical protein
VEEAGAPTAREQIFVSYGRRDGAEVAGELCALLEDHGYRAWLDTRDIPAGSVFPVRIQTGIEDSNLLVAVLTPWSVRPESWCLNELIHAQHSDVPILPVRVADGITPPITIASLSYIDVFGDREGAFVEVLARIEEIRSTGRSPFREFGADAPWWTRLERLDFGADLARHGGQFVGREWLFDLLRERIRESDTRIILLTGAPGIGKTAIAAQASAQLNVRGVHFCSRRIDRSCRPESWLAGLVHQLALQFPAYGEQLESLNEPDWQDTRSVFRTVIADPLRRVASSIDVSEPLVFVVDGLDEAVAFEGHGMSLALRDAVVDFPPWLRVIVTCRPDQALRDSFELPNIRVDEIAADSEPNLADVRAYVESRVRRLPDVSNDPGERAALVRWIVGAVEGNFLVASMNLDELAERGLEGFKGPDTEAMFPRTAKGHYTRWFQNRFDRDEYRGRLRPLLEALVAARSPLPRDLICRTVENRYDAEDGLSALSQFLERADGGLVLSHKTLADWLVSYAGAEHVVLPEHGHQKLAEICAAEYDKGVDQLSPYALRHLPAHLMLSGDWARAIQVLDDARYRQRKIEHGHYDDLIADLEMAQRDQPGSLTAEQTRTLSDLWTKVPERGEGAGEGGAEEEPTTGDPVQKLMALLGQASVPGTREDPPKPSPDKSSTESNDRLMAMMEMLLKGQRAGERPAPAKVTADNELLLGHLEVRGITRETLDEAMVKRPGAPAPDLDDPIVLNRALRAFFAQVLPRVDVEEILATRRPAENPHERLEAAQKEIQERVAAMDLAGARKIVERLADEPLLDDVRKNWLAQLDEAEQSLETSRAVEGVIERVKAAAAMQDFERARAVVEELPDGEKGVKALRRSILKQLAEAEHAARIGSGSRKTSGPSSTPVAQERSDAEPARAACCPRCGTPVGAGVGTRIVGVLVGLLMLFPPLALLFHSKWWLVLVVPMALVGVLTVFAQATGRTFCRKCGWSGYARRRGSDREGPGSASPGSWIQTPELSRAVSDANLSGATFTLRRIDLTDNGLLFAFTSRGDLPEERAHDAGLALRCVVGQTLPAAVHHTRGVSTEDELAYQVKLSSGVPISAPKLRNAERVTDYLQVVSAEASRLLLVTIKPAFVSSTHSRERAEDNKEVLRQLLPFFRSLRATQIVLGQSSHQRPEP